MSHQIEDKRTAKQQALLAEKNAMSKALGYGTVEVSRRPKGLFLKYFALSAGVVLSIAGLAKVWTGLGDSQLLVVVDPILGIRFKHLMLLMGVGEIAIALVCFFVQRQTLALGLVAWLSTNFVVYRLGLWWMNWKKPCGCLGNLTDALGISPQAADNIMKVLLAYLLIGSYGLLIWQWRKGKKLRVEPTAPSLGATTG